MRRTTRQSLVRLAIKRNSRAEISVRVMATARPIYTSMLSAHTDSDFCRIGNHKVSQLFGLVVLYYINWCPVWVFVLGQSGHITIFGDDLLRRDLIASSETRSSRSFIGFHVIQWFSLLFGASPLKVLYDTDVDTPASRGPYCTIRYQRVDIFWRIA
jgi:hypothetical protein